MNILIDTQILIWIQENNAAISQQARIVLTSPENQIYVSQISFFEIAIKLKIGKLPAFRVTVGELLEQTTRDGIGIIQLSNRHIVAYDQVPLYTDHRDSFDRLITCVDGREDANYFCRWTLPSILRHCRSDLVIELNR